MNRYTQNDWRFFTPFELYHHGIKGQKWGVRRFQNADGSLTSAGKQRYSSDKRPKIEESFNAYENGLLKRGEKEDKLYEEGYKKLGSLGDPYNDKSKAYTEVADKWRKEYVNTMENFDKLDIVKKWRAIEDAGSRNPKSNYYNDPKNKKIRDEYLRLEKERDDKLSKSFSKIRDELSGIVLNELGYADTKAGREFIKLNEIAMEDPWFDYSGREFDWYRE